MKVIISGVCLLFALTSAAHAQDSRGRAASKPVTVEFKNSDGQSVGSASLSSSPKGVKITLDVKNLPPGEHSLHIHQVAKCDPPDFKSAGPHFNAGGAEHSHESMPAGDIPNFSLIVGADGTAHVSVIAPNVTLGDDDHSVFSNGGTSIVIHAVAGGTGTAAPARIACGIISKP
jgi:superoxide dismutase, Cu-Zn family